MPTIDIHEWPATPTLDYQIAVMQAAAKGSTVEGWDGNSWATVDYPGWNWMGGRYRIKRSVPEFKAGDWIVGSGGSVFQIKEMDSLRNVCRVDRFPWSVALSCFRPATADEVNAHLGNQPRVFKVGDYVRIPKILGRGLRIDSKIGQIVKVYSDGGISLVYADRSISHDGQYKADELAPATSDEIMNYQCAAARHKAAQIAPGHNADQLTNAQIDEGYRLLDADEIKDRAANMRIEVWQWWPAQTSCWVAGTYGNNAEHTYRTRLSRAELAALDAPKIQHVPMRSEDFPPAVWIRLKGDKRSRMFSPSMVCDTGMRLNAEYDDIDHQQTWFPYQDLMDDGAEWSPDRIHWYPCYKTI